MSKAACCPGCTRAIDVKGVRVLNCCPTCRRCQHCECRCTSCMVCHARVPSFKPFYCRRCRTCSSCDTCRSMPHFIRPELLATRRGRSLFNTLPRLLGIELELAEWGRMRDLRFKHLSYDVAHDWSVQPSGQEMVLKPLAGDAFIRAMFELGQTCYTAGAVVNQTCALHVHVDGSDLSYWEIRRLLEIYTRLEGEIYDYLILPHRRDDLTVTHYCQMMTRPHPVCDRCERYDSQYPQQRFRMEPVQKTLARMYQAKTTADLKTHLLRMLYRMENPINAGGAEIAARKGGRYEWCRYVGMNLHAWQYRGTVEWRMKEGTTDVEDLVIWPLFCGWFTHAVTRMNDVDAKAVTNLVDFADKYMPSFVAAWVRRKRGV